LGDLIDLEQRFQAAFGIPLAALPMPPHLGRIFPGALLYGSELAKQKPLLTQSDVEEFVGCPREGYFQIGFWGHGVNSYAFYYVRDDPRSRVYLRLPFGGVYMDNEENATRIARFLPALFEFERTQLEAGSTLLAVDSMGAGDYRLTTKDGELMEYACSLCGNPKFYDTLNIAGFLRSRSA
jgi:hypothetical protein